MSVDIVDNVLESCKSLQGFIQIGQPAVKSVDHGMYTSQSNPKISKSKGPSRSTSHVKDDHDSDDALNTLKSIFPDYGKAFLLACLKVRADE